MDKLLLDDDFWDYGIEIERRLPDPHPHRSWFVRLTLSAGMLGGLFALVAVPSVRVWRQKLTGWLGSPSRRSTGRPFSVWCKGVLGRNRLEIMHVLGRPQATSIGDDVNELNPSYWRATTWYYRYESREMSAVALAFREDHVVRVEYIGKLNHQPR